MYRKFFKLHTNKQTSAKPSINPVSKQATTKTKEPNFAELYNRGMLTKACIEKELRDVDKLIASISDPARRVQLEDYRRIVIAILKKFESGFYGETNGVVHIVH